MKEIKTKPAGGKPKLLESAAKAPKTAMKDLWLKTKEKSVSELKETPFASQQEESSNAPANTAADQMLSGTKSTVKKGADLTYRGGKKLAQTTAKKAREKREVSRVLKEAKEMAEKPAKGTASKIKSKDAMVKGLKGKPAKTVKTASQSMKGVKQGAKGIKTAQRSAKTAQQAAKAAQKTAQAAARAAKAAAQAAKAAAKAAATGVKIAVKATVAAVKAALLAIKGLIAAIAAGGWVAVVIILLICLIALIVGSCFGLFFGSDSTGTGTSVTQAVSALNGEYLSHIQEIEDSNPHDRQEITSNDGALSINWEDVLAVFSAKVTGAEDGAQVASLDDAQVQQLRDIMWEMNAVSSSTRTESHEVEVIITDEDGNETTRTETVTETILEITITHKTPEEMARQYSFNPRQNEYLALMSEPENQSLWAELLGGYTSGGQIMNPNTDWQGTGIFQWPLPQSYTITSWFGYREDPFTGEIAYHSGIDIAAPGGTPILAAADGAVTIANAIDSWGGGYGYHIKVKHNDTYETLYAHCSSICVTVGQEVKQGEVIGYVGTTGNSTGNHLHFEVWQNGERTDALGFFKAE
ncbi:Murein hydrolase activator NlpD precursor [uncultured Ruminococcus sp.]|nr:Murein hydrolase activator NlpD precursor [uncultured Clostridium sp.]SCI00361.1 Murein hydrolase activator NlpD precursor [uncultured Ruminococcus sp.]